MEGSALQVLSYNSNPVRIVNVDGEQLWVAKDVCECLGLDDARRAVERLDEDEWSSTPVTDALGRMQETICVNEPGLYSLILGSRKPEAKAFKRWVTHEVLPSLRKTGSYGCSAPKLEHLDLVPRIVKAFKSGLVGKAEARATLGLPPESSSDDFFASQSPHQRGTKPTKQRSLFEQQSSQSPRPRGTTLRARLTTWREANHEVFTVDASALMVELGIAPDAETAGSMVKVRQTVSAELRKLGVESLSQSQSPLHRGSPLDFDKALATVNLSPYAETGFTIADVLKMLCLPNVRSNQSKLGAALKRAGWARRRSSQPPRPWIFVSLNPLINGATEAVN